MGFDGLAATHGVQPLAGLALDVHACQRNSQQAGQVPPDPPARRRDPRRLENHGRIEVGHCPAAGPGTSHGVTDEPGRVGIGPATVAVGKESAQVGTAQGAEDSIGYRVQQSIAIGVGHHAARVANTHAPDDQRPDLRLAARVGETVAVVPVPDTQIVRHSEAGRAGAGHGVNAQQCSADLHRDDTLYARRERALKDLQQSEPATSKETRGRPHARPAAEAIMSESLGWRRVQTTASAGVRWLTLAGTVAMGGCWGWMPGYRPGGSQASLDEYTYESTAEVQQTVALRDWTTGEEIWRLDVPVGKQVVIRFYDEQNPTQADRPAIMRWQIMDRGTMFGELRNAIPAPDATRRRVEVYATQPAQAKATPRP